VKVPTVGFELRIQVRLLAIDLRKEGVMLARLPVKREESLPMRLLDRGEACVGIYLHRINPWVELRRRPVVKSMVPPFPDPIADRGIPHGLIHGRSKELPDRIGFDFAKRDVVECTPLEFWNVRRIYVTYDPLDCGREGIPGVIYVGRCERVEQVLLVQGFYAIADRRTMPGICNEYPHDERTCC
jgi:hypothetical protein